jgi:sugar phosphate isomerase/epimerase
VSEHGLDRRTFLGAAAASLAAVGLGVPRGAFAADRTGAPDAGLRLGVASYSLRQFPLDRAIAMTKALGTRWINLKSVHLSYDAPPAEVDRARAAIAAAGLEIVGGGTITFDVDSDAGVERYFAYARAAGMPLVVATCDPAVLPRVERFAVRYDVKVAIHNPGPEDPHFPAPADVLRRVKGMDPRMGLCIDVGHTVRTGADVVQAVADAGPRLLDMHAKDLRDLRDKESQCAVGEGKIPIADVFRQLLRSRFQGVVNLEYEIDPADPRPGMQRSLAYMRGVLAGLAPASRPAASR